MHAVDDLSYQRGYEWWLMTEAKKVQYSSLLVFNNNAFSDALRALFFSTFRGIPISSYMDFHGRILHG